MRKPRTGSAKVFKERWPENTVRRLRRDFIMEREVAPVE
jgi:hypothetical protein